MKILAVETSGKAASAAVYGDGYLSEVFFEGIFARSEQIMEMVDRALSMVGLEPDDMDAFAAAVGPGSYTGIRIGIMTVEALAEACQKPCAAVCTLDALAENLCLFDGLVCPIIDARREQVYTAAYWHGERVIEPYTDMLLDYIARLKQENVPVAFVGDGVRKYYPIIEREMPEAAVAPNQLLLQRASGVAAAAARLQQFQSPGTLEPLYLGLAEAERRRMGL